MNDKSNDSLNISAEKNQVDLYSLNNSEKASSRRRLLLGGVLKGSALAASAVPIKSFASTSSITANGLICTISGTQSAAHSQKASLPTCGGLSPGYYKMVSHWPNFNVTTGVATNSVNGKTFTQNSTFKSVFGNGPTATLIYILVNQTSTIEFHYIAALLNAIKAPSGYVFPYSASEVVAFYNNTSQQASAVTFFKNYMETI